MNREEYEALPREKKPEKGDVVRYQLPNVKFKGLKSNFAPRIVDFIDEEMCTGKKEIVADLGGTRVLIEYLKIKAKGKKS